MTVARHNIGKGNLSVSRYWTLLHEISERDILTSAIGELPIRLGVFRCDNIYHNEILVYQIV